MKKTFLLTLFATLLSTFPARAQENIDIIRSGAHILAHQFHAKKLDHKAKVMTKFLSLIGPQNKDSASLISAINNSKTTKFNERLKDNGIQYAKYLYENGINALSNLNLEHKKKNEIIGIVCTTIDSRSPAQKYLTNASITPQAFYQDLFKIKGILGQRNKVAEVYKKAILPSFTYTPAEFLKGISTVNSFLALTGAQVKINQEQLGQTPIKIDSVDQSKGYIIYKGPQIRSASHDRIAMNSISLKDFLRYIEHTTRLAPQFNLLENSLEFHEAQKGKKGRPIFFKSTTSLYNEIKTSRDKARAKYNNKSMQIRGKVTKIKDTGSKYYIELDNIYIIEIDKARLKNNASESLQKQLKENQQNSTQFMLIARGICQIGTKAIYLKDCRSVLVEKTATFYTK